jgi:hypothetical protein
MVLIPPHEETSIHLSSRCDRTVEDIVDYGTTDFRATFFVSSTIPSHLESFSMTNVLVRRLTAVPMATETVGEVFQWGIVFPLALVRNLLWS